MSEELATTTRRASAPMSFNDVQRMALAVSKSGMFSVKTPEQALALMLICQSEGLHPMQAVNRYHIIQGRPSMKAEAMLAEFQRRGGSVRWIERTDKAAEAEFSSEASSPVIVRWTMEDAKRANLVGKDNWRQYPRAMLHARCVSEGVRAVLPDCVVGIYTPEEAESLPPTSAGIEELEAKREAHARGQGRVEILPTDLSQVPVPLSNAPGVERVDGMIVSVDKREVIAKGEEFTVFDAVFIRADKSTLLAWTRKVDLAHDAQAFCHDGTPVVAGVKKQADGNWKLLSVETAEAAEAPPKEAVG